MDFNENNDEIEQLRLIALKSMVRRSKKNSSDTVHTDVYDQDIKLLRAEALETITRKRNSQNNSLVNKDEERVKSQNVNNKKRCISALSSLPNKKSIKLNKNETTGSKDLSNYSNLRKSSEVSNDDHKQKYICKPKLECNFESQSKSQVQYIAESHSKTAVNDNKDSLNTIFRNGCMQLSNLNSEKIVESMIVTFSSSESDDLSTECDTIMNDDVTQKTRYNNLMNLLAHVPVNVKTTDSVSLEDNKLKINNCMKQLCELMRYCEANIEKRNQQIEILLEAYIKYQNYNKSISSILQTMKTIRDELSNYHSLEVNALNS